MDLRDIELIERLAEGDGELAVLWRRHRELEQALERLEERRFLTPQERQRREELKKAKLAGRDRIQAILEEHK
jgi:uncharacterized protein YdcH (DUF465 family)